LHRILKKPEYDLTLHSKVQEYFEKVEKLSLKTELAKENFFETFKLNPDSIFGKLVADLMRLFDWVYPRSKFLKGAYGFWRRSFARQPEKIPDSWKPFLRGDDDVFKFMFCLESAHALLARLILAKACEDLKFPGIGISNFVVQKIHQFRGQIPLVGYPIVLLKLLKEMKDQLVYSIFEEDIFSWWSDVFVPLSEKSSGELLQEKVDKELEDFSETIAKLLFILYKYDFSEVAGDPLGDLYQQYFDAETRKALGEFYTPVEVVNYIIDAVEYKYVRHKRLLDPACGSGTFLVEALKRYLREMEPIAKENGWAFVLKELCNSPRIVGFDIHPFACLIAQVRFMIELIPYYKKAVEEEGFKVYASLQRLPILRTDSLAIEMKPSEFQRGPKLLDAGEDIRFRVSLPIKANGEETITATVTIPSWKKTSIGTEYNLFNLDEYFCVIQAVFDAVKRMFKVEADGVPTKVLEAHTKEYLTKKDFRVIAEFFKPYADNLMDEIKRLAREIENGRLIKSIEDTVLAAFLKNYLQYDFVVGNPPYIRIYKIEDVKYYKETFFTASGQFDIYVPFIERGIEWLKKGGKLGFITSNKYFATEYGENLRIFILNNCVIEQIVDVSSVKVFAQAIYPVITIFRREAQEIIEQKKIVNKYHQKIKVAIVRQDDPSLLQELRLKWLNDERIDNPAIETMEISQKRFYGNLNFVFDISIRPEAENLLNKIEQDYVPLKNCGVIVSGTTGFEQEKWRKCIRDDPEINKECRKFITSHNIYPFCIKWGIPVRIQKMLFKHPYIVYDPQNITSGKWQLFKRKKIVIKAMARKLTAAYDQEGFGIGKVYAITSLNNPLYILGLLNSKVLDYYYKSKFISTHLAGGYIRYNKPQLERLPIKIPRMPEQELCQKEIIRKVSDLLHIHSSEDIMRNLLNIIAKEYQNAGCEFDEINYVFNKNHVNLKPILSGQPKKGYFVYPAEEESPIWLETKEKAMLFIIAIDKRAIKKNESVNILIPRNNLIASEILEKIKYAVKELEPNSQKRLQQKIEKEIDKLVYQLYGLSEEDQKTIESYLEQL
jgi:hypothetical protein